MTTMLEEAVQTLQIKKEIDINAPLEIAYQALLEELGSGATMPDGKPFPMKFEAWPGGRWFRDLGEGAGHFWGHVQVIKPPTLIEVCGPLFMSYPAANFVQYRLTAEGKGARITLTHRALGLLDSTHIEGVHKGWQHKLEAVRTLAQRRMAGKQGK